MSKRSTRNRRRKRNRGRGNPSHEPMPVLPANPEMVKPAFKPHKRSLLQKLRDLFSPKAVQPKMTRVR